MRTVALNERMLSCVASEAPTPEEALITAEEGREAARRAPALVAWAALANGSIERVGAALRQIPQNEAAAVGLWFGGRTQREIADQLGVTQGAAWKSIRRGTLRLRWLTGPATWFAPVDVDLDLGPSLGIDAAVLLGTLWETTSQTVTARRLNVDRREVHERFSSLMSGELRSVARVRGVRRYLRGFLELRDWGQGLLAPRRQDCRQGTAA